jgi:hypothetical protein
VQGAEKSLRFEASFGIWNLKFHIGVDHDPPIHKT